MRWTKLGKNKWRAIDSRLPPVITLQDATSCNRGWRYCRGWYDGVRQGDWVYIAATNLEEAQALVAVLIRLEES